MGVVRRALVGAGAALGGLAAANAYVRATAPREAEQPPGEERWFLWRTGRVAYYEAGAGADVLLLHGPNAAASAYEMRRPLAGWSERRRAVAPDLPGFGRSDRPAADYTGELYARFVADFAEAVTAPGAVLVASSLSAAYAIAAVAARPQHFSALVLINPTVAARTPPGGGFWGALLRMPVVGEALFNALAARPSLAYFLGKKTFAHPDRLAPEFLAQNYAVSHQDGARFAPAAFISGGLNLPEAWAQYAKLRLPILLIWGAQAAYVRQEQRDAWEAQNPQARSVTVPDAGMLPHEERPEVFLTDVELFLEEAGVRRG